MGMELGPQHGDKTFEDQNQRPKKINFIGGGFMSTFFGLKTNFKEINFCHRILCFLAGKEE